MGRILTSAAANKLLKSYNDKVEHLYLLEMQRKTYVQIQGADENKPDYDFQKTREEIDRLNKNILAIKHAINSFNCKTTIKNIGLTIDQALIRMAQLTKIKSTMDGMRSMQKKQLEQMGVRTSGVVGYTMTSYEPADAQLVYDAVCEELATLQLELDIINNTEEIIINDID